MNNKKQPKVTVAKMAASLIWLNIIASPFVIALCCDNLIVVAIGILYGIIVWEVSKRFTPKWMFDAMKYMFRTGDEEYDSDDDAE